MDTRRRDVLYCNTAEVCSFAAAAELQRQGAVFRTLDGRTHAMLHCRHVFATVYGMAGGGVSSTCQCAASIMRHERLVFWRLDAGMVPRRLLHVYLPEGRDGPWAATAMLHSVLECAHTFYSNEGRGHVRLYCITEAEAPALENKWLLAAGVCFARCACYWRLRAGAIRHLEEGHTSAALQRAILAFV